MNYSHAHQQGMLCYDDKPLGRKLLRQSLTRQSTKPAHLGQTIPTMMNTAGLLVTTICLTLLIACGGGGGGSNEGPSPTVPTKVKWSVIPFANGLSIQWHNLPGFKRVGSPQQLHFNLTSGNPPMVDRRSINITSFIDDVYNLTDLIDDTAYQFSTMIELTFPGNTSQLWAIAWEDEKGFNELDNNNSGIVTGVNYDQDGRADSVDDDDDNDGVDDTHTDGTVWDLCSARQMGELDWTSGNATDHDGDGCRDATEDTDDDNDGLADEHEEPQCLLIRDCDNDTLLDGNEEPGCTLSADCDNDTLLDKNEMAGCAAIADCDGDRIADSVDRCHNEQQHWRSDSTNDPDQDGCHNDEDVDDDGDSLIEIATADAFNNIRWVLDGSGFKKGENAELNTTGCGGMDDTATCHGYELTTNISLAGYREGDGWEPIAADIDSTTENCDGEKFSGIFDGNGFVISNLTINRRQEYCIGLFGQVDGSIRNLGVLIEQINGRGSVGGLIGSGVGATIVDAYAVSSAISRGVAVGGLVGDGRNATIMDSYALSSSVEGSVDIGGLVGDGRNVRLVNSYAISKVIDGFSDNVGGLVGVGENAMIVSSHAVSETISGGSSLGGLIGRAANSIIIQAYAVSGVISGNPGPSVGLVGSNSNARGKNPTTIVNAYVISETIEAKNFGDVFGFAGGVNTRLVNSYMVGGTFLSNSGNTPSLTFPSFVNLINHSYWDSQTSGITSAGFSGSSPQTSNALRSPTGYDDIYSRWDDGVMIDGIDDSSTIWCDEDLTGAIETKEMRDNNRVWDFGTNMTYPAIRCTADSIADQRSWWYLNTTDNKPYLNRTKLNQRINGFNP